ncbi:hypothetical protein SMICM17S_06802 [Streptomyces microflavus]
MIVVPRMKPSTASSARRPIASTRSPVPRGAARVREVRRPVGVPQEEEGQQESQHTGRHQRADQADTAEQAPGGARGRTSSARFLALSARLVDIGVAADVEVVDDPLPASFRARTYLVAGVDEGG